MKFLLPIWIIAAAAAALQGYYLTQLPDRVAVHFNAGGVADRWSTPASLAAAAWGALGSVTVLGSVSILLMGRIPDRFVNLPNKAYWLDPERRDATIEWLQGFTAVLMSAILLLLLVIFQFVFEYNQGNRAAMGAPLQGVLFGALPLILIVPLVILLKRFSRVGDDA